jgi:hypothetical protein
MRSLFSTIFELVGITLLIGDAFAAAAWFGVLCAGAALLAVGVLLTPPRRPPAAPLSEVDA